MVMYLTDLTLQAAYAKIPFLDPVINHLSYDALMYSAFDLFSRLMDPTTAQHLLLCEHQEGVPQSMSVLL